MRPKNKYGRAKVVAARGAFRWVSCQGGTMEIRHTDGRVAAGIIGAEVVIYAAFSKSGKNEILPGGRTAIESYLAEQLEATS